MRRSRPLVVVVGLLLAGLVMLAWTQTWFTLRLSQGAAVVHTVVADGSAVVPSYTALAIASLALFLALTIAGRVLRVVLGVVQVVLGVAIVGTGIGALSDPVRAARSAVGVVSGVSDLAAVRRAVSSVDTSAWPVVGIVGGALGALLGVAVIVLQRSWPGPSRKYGDAAARPARAADAPRDAVVDWDDLSAGVDPTDERAGVDPADERAGVDPADERAGVDRADRRAGVDPADEPVGLTARRSDDGAHDNEEHREQH